MQGLAEGSSAASQQRVKTTCTKGSAQCFLQQRHCKSLSMLSAPSHLRQVDHESRLGHSCRLPAGQAGENTVGQTDACLLCGGARKVVGVVVVVAGPGVMGWGKGGGWEHRVAACIEDGVSCPLDCRTWHSMHRERSTGAAWHALAWRQLSPGPRLPTSRSACTLPCPPARAQSCPHAPGR